MYTFRQNSQVILDGGQPDFYGDIMDAMAICPDPIFLRDLCPQDGELHQDSWGTTKKWAPGEPGETPVTTDENKVIKDIEDWKDYVAVPPVDNLDWSMAEAFAKSVNRDEKWVCYFSTTGLFERSHFLMGMEDAMCNYLLYPEEMVELLTVIKDWKIECIRQAHEHLNPDAIFYQDDWGSKQNLFLPPDVWREIIKPLQQEISDVIHECGMLYVHHSDCYRAQIVEDMVDIGIDVWQGVIPENPIEEIKERTQGKLAMQGGIDTPAYDNSMATEESIRAGVRADLDRCLPGGRFFVGCPGGRAFNEWNNGILQDELRRYGRQWAVDHPVGDVREGFDMDEYLAMFGDKVIIPSDNAA